MPFEIFTGDALHLLRSIPSGSIHSVVTSPPWWGLRDYGVAGQIGVESSIQTHVKVIVDVFREVRRVLRFDGSLWMHYGDKYLHGQLLMMPHRVAIALQEDGWIVRQDNVWAKTNVIPTHGRRRPVRSHDYVFLLTKTRHYYYDHLAEREAATGNAHSRGTGRYPKEAAGIKAGANTMFSSRTHKIALDRNVRSVWNMPTEPCKDAHYATYPQWLVKRCLKLSTSSVGSCAHCGSPFTRVLEEAIYGSWTQQEFRGTLINRSITASKRSENYETATTIGWGLTCSCPIIKPVPCKVLDPFSGTGTTGVAALKLGLQYVGFELNPEYVAMSERRLSAVLDRISEQSHARVGSGE
jgi:DNA modification methylase